MAIPDEIRTAIRAAREAAQPNEDDLFKAILDQVAEGITTEDVKAEVTSSVGPRWTLLLSPAHQPGRRAAMLQVVRTAAGVDLLTDPKQSAGTPDGLADTLKRFVTNAAFLESLDRLAQLSREPVEGTSASPLVPYRATMSSSWSHRKFSATSWRRRLGTR